MSHTIYQLVAKGKRLRIDESGVIYSKMVFYHKDKAEQYIPVFIAACTIPTDELDIQVLSNDGIQVVINELELDNYIIELRNV